MRKIAVNSLLLACSLGLIYLLLEGLVWWMMPEPPWVGVDRDISLEQTDKAEVEPKDPGTHPSGLLYMSTDSGLRLKPNVAVTIVNHSTSHRDIFVRTNSLGFRGPEIGEKKGRRILFLGDSITVADYAQEEETFPAQVQSLLEAEGKNVEVINAGVGGVGLETELAILKETGLRVMPDVVIIAFYLNDFNDSPFMAGGRLPDWLGRSRLAHFLMRAWAFIMPESVKSKTDSLTIKKWKIEFFSKVDIPSLSPNDRSFLDVVQRSFGDWGGAFSPQAWSIIAPLLEEFAGLSRQYGFQPLLVCFPSEQQVSAEKVWDYPQARLEETARQAGIAVLDLLPVLRAAARPEKNIGELYLDQCHLTPKGNGIVARAIKSSLDKNPFTPEAGAVLAAANAAARDRERALSVRCGENSSKSCRPVVERAIKAFDAVRNAEATYGPQSDPAREATKKAERVDAERREVLQKVRLEDLRALRQALDAYGAKRKEYPKSQGLDGRFSRWGKASEEWIEGLAPEFIAALPAEPRCNCNPADQYLYASDGKDYKIIVHNPEDLAETTRMDPSLTDPARPGNAYGYWTPGAVKW